ncbi:hypothetical protein ES703_81979 [subsurface metagenome]
MSEDIIIEPAVQTDLTSIEGLLRELFDAMEDTEGFDLERSVENCRLLGAENPYQRCAYCPRSNEPPSLCLRIRSTAGDVRYSQARGNAWSIASTL